MKKIIIAGITVNALTEEDAILITPHQAESILKQDNDNFRKISPNEVTKYTKYMKRGHWKFNGDTIGFDKDGKLKDGQHRLTSCVHSNIPLLTIPVLIDDDTSIDTRKRLEFDEILLSLGYANSRNLSSTIRLLYRYYNKYPNYVNVMQSIDNNSLYNFFMENIDIVDSFNNCGTYARNRRGNITHSLLAGLYHIMKTKDANLARDIVRILSLDIYEYDRIGITKLDAMYHLKQYLLSESADNKIPMIVKAALFIKTWNHWRDESICNRLSWVCTGPNPEEFPEIK